MAKKLSDVAQLRALLNDGNLLPAIAEVLRVACIEREIEQGELVELLGSQPTASRFLAGQLTPTALKRDVPRLSRFLRSRLKLTVTELKRRVQSRGLLLCINGPGCASIHFHASNYFAVPVPCDPRTEPDDTNCPHCGEPLSATCPNCDSPVVAASHCPKCGHRYIAEVPDSLRGLGGRELAQACYQQNLDNQITREHPDKRRSRY